MLLLKYYITKGSKTGRVFCVLVTYLNAKEAYVLADTVHTAIVAPSPHTHWKTRSKQIREHIALQASNDR